MQVLARLILVLWGAWFLIVVMGIPWLLGMGALFLLLALANGD